MKSLVNAFMSLNRLGGPDPLDYISMYCNPGDPSLRVPEHWHYISFGISDLHGDGRVHEVLSGDRCGKPSGFGFELTFRLKREPGELFPPTWPAGLMQALAKYIFGSGRFFFNICTVKVYKFFHIQVTCCTLVTTSRGSILLITPSLAYTIC